MAVSTEEKKPVITVCNPGDLEYKIEIATKTLERNIGFVTNCDNKASIMLTAIGVLLTILLTNDGLKEIYGIIESCINAKTFCCVLYLICFVVSVFIMAVGIFNLGSVLLAKTLEKADGLEAMDSRIFFYGIRKNRDFNSYRSKFYSMEQKELLDELIAQIFINADIATQKYEKYNLGLKRTLIGFFMFIIVFLIGIYLY
ncbi:hypothetical protein SDC9_156214 [bioreactor metagenome]|uniref:Pycsar effector protein domain-containing protein n=1 Tax=bioreactor metagenome TaxID=1076179 RepID=A0A645F5M2_9ZZZZ